ncbi:MAG: DUF6112 family protein [Actinomycetota bacterium]|nr:DUF6112 family protein [Actinomycetota bacterium]
MYVPLLAVNISPNTSGLPGISELENIVGGLLTVGLVAAIAGLIVSAIVWALGHHSGNPNHSSKGKTGVLASFVAALLIGGADVLINFFVAAGHTL